MSRDRNGLHATRTPIRYRIEVATELYHWQRVASSDDRTPYPELIELAARPPGPAQLSCDVQSWGEAEGLPANSVNSLAQTPDGYLWVATGKGLARFDGVQFHRYDQRNLPELGTSAFGALYCDPGGRLWIELLATSGNTNNLATYEHGHFTRLDTRGHHVQFVRVDATGTPWLSCDRGGFPWREGRLDTQAALAPFAGHSALQAVVDDDQNLWLANDQQMGKVAGSNWSPLTLVDAGATLGPNLKTLVGTRSRKGGAWLTTGGIDGYTSFGPNLLARLTRDGRLTEPKPFPWAKRDFRTGPICEDPSGQLWVAANAPDYGIYRMSPDENSYERYGEEEGLRGVPITSILADRGGNLWVGTEQGGINVFRPPSFRTLAPTGPSKATGIQSVAAARDGGVWLCANEIGIFRWKEGRQSRLFTGTVPFGVVFEDSTGGVWTGGEGFGGDRYAARRWQEVIPSKNRVLDRTMAYFEDRHGRVWMGGPYGLAVYDQGRSALYAPPGFTSSATDAVIAVAEAPDDALWLGTQSGRLLRFQEGHFVVHWQSMDPQPSPVCSLYFDRAGTLWFARFGEGLARWEKGITTLFTTAQGLPTATINGLIEDARGFIWLSSKTGVYRIAQEDLQAFGHVEATQAHWRHFTKRDGLPSLECYGEQYQPGMCRSTDGRIWVPTLPGVAVVDPALLINPPAPSVAVEEVQLIRKDKQIRTLVQDEDYQRHQGQDPLTVTVPPGRNNLVIRYAGIDLDDPALMSFRYRIAGLDPGWVDVKGARSAVYSAVKPGRYHFEVVALNKSGQASSPAALALQVLPLWWETTIFQALLIALLVAVGPAIYYYRVRWLQRRHQLQVAFSRQLIQREEDERKRVAQQVHDVLGHELLLLKNAAVQGEQRTEPGSAPASQFRQISSIASRALQESREIAHRLRPIELDRLGLKPALEALLDATAASSGLRVFREIDDVAPVLPAELQVHLYRLVQEGLNNILKHARATTVMCELQLGDDRIRLHLADDGVGFDPAVTKGGRRGLGLTSLEERVRLMGGEFELTSASGAGTHLRLSFPLPGR